MLDAKGDEGARKTQSGYVTIITPYVHMNGMDATARDNGYMLCNA